MCSEVPDQADEMGGSQRPIPAPGYSLLIMEDDGRRHVPDPLAAQPRAKAQIDILEPKAAEHCEAPEFLEYPA